MDSDLLVLGTVFYMNAHNEANPFLAWADSVKLEYPGKFKTEHQPYVLSNLQSFTDCSMKLSIRYNFFFLLICIAFTISFHHLIIVQIYVFRAFSPILMVNYCLCTNPYRMPIFEKSVICSFSSVTVFIY